MTAGRTIWLATDVQRHRRALMIELKQEHGPVAIACDTVLCSKAKLQNDERGIVRDGFASIAEEAGCTRDEVRKFVEHAAQLGWLDDLDLDDDGRRFNCRISGWRADQDKAYASWRKRGQRSRDKSGDVSPNDTTNGQESRSVPECPTTGQDRTVLTTPCSPPQAGDEAPHRPAGARGRDQAAYRDQMTAWAAEHFPGVPVNGIEQLVTWVRRNGPATPAAVREFAAAAPNFAHLIEPEASAA